MSTKSTKASKAVEALLEDRDTGIWFQLLCEWGPRAVKSQAWQLRDELRWSPRGEVYELTAIQDALLDLAHDLLPDSPAGSDEAWHEARDELWRTAQKWFTEGSRRLNPYDFVGEDLNDVWAEDSSLAALRAYLRGCMRAALLTN